MTEPDPFNYSSYERFLQDRFDSRKRSGAIKALAKVLRVHPSRVTRMIRGTQHPTQEQAYLIAGALGLPELPTAYFVTLVDLARATRPEFKKHLRAKLADLKSGRLLPSEMTPHPAGLSAADEVVLHSDPLYYLTWHASAIAGENTPDAIARRLNVDVELVQMIADFLCKVGLTSRDGLRVNPAVRSYELPSDSKQLSRFLVNWHLQAVRKISAPTERDLIYSEPMSIGYGAYEQIRSLLKASIENAKAILASEASETVACMNIDFFEIGNGRKRN